MGIFSNTTPFDEQLDKVTNELNTETDWGAVLSLCDKIKVTSNGAAIFAPALMAKINNKVPHVSMQAITILDACINNCGKDFKKVVSSQGLTEGLNDFLNRYKNPTVTRRLRYFIKKWADEFKEDTQMSNFVSFYYKLRAGGMEFPDTEDENPSKKKVEVSTDPNVASSQQEADDIAKAIEASLQEEKQKKSVSFAPTTSIYPSVTGGSTYAATSSSNGAASSHAARGRKVKALYDFEAAEDNELTFKTGDIISILDDSDLNWWKGEGANGTGLFPSNFVTSDLTKDVEEEKITEKKETTVKFNEALEVKEVLQSEPVLQIDEDLIDNTLAALQSTDPETTTSDPEELTRNEESCLQMGKLIDTQLEGLDRKHLELTVLNQKILESLQMYDNLMKQAPVYSASRYPPMTNPGRPAMMTGYSTNPQYSNAYMTAPQAMPQQMGVPPNDPSQGYNPMYQGGPPNTYVQPMGTQQGVTSIEQQRAATQQNQSFPTNQNPPQGHMMSYGGTQPQSNVNYPDGSTPPVMSQYQASSGVAGSTQPSNYSTNHISSQPLM